MSYSNGIDLNDSSSSPGTCGRTEICFPQFSVVHPTLRVLLSKVTRQPSYTCIDDLISRMSSRCQFPLGIQDKRDKSYFITAQAICSRLVVLIKKQLDSVNGCFCAVWCACPKPASLPLPSLSLCCSYKFIDATRSLLAPRNAATPQTVWVHQTARSSATSSGSDVAGGVLGIQL